MYKYSSYFKMSISTTLAAGAVFFYEIVKSFVHIHYVKKIINERLLNDVEWKRWAFSMKFT